MEAIFQNIPEAVIVTDSVGHPLNFNQVAETLLGKIPGDIEPGDWPRRFGFYLDDEKTKFPADKMPLVRALNGESVQGEEMILVSNSGQENIWIAMSSQPLHAADGNIIGAVVVFRDVSYRKRIEISREKQFQRAEALFTISRLISEIGNDLPQILTTVANYTAEIVGDASVISMLQPPGDRLQIMALHHRNPNARALLRKLLDNSVYNLDEGIVGGVIRSGEPLLIPYINPSQLKSITLPGYRRYIQKFGVQSYLSVPIKGRKDIHGTLGVSRDQGGQPYTADDQALLMDIAQRTALAIDHCMLVDSLLAEISERRIAEQALEESEIRFRSIFESTVLGIKVIDLEGTLLQVNPAFQEMVGFSNEELSGKHFASFIQPADASKIVRQYELLITGEVMDFRLEHRIIHKDGSIVWVNATFTAVKKNREDDSPAFIVGITENITGRKQIELEMAEMKSRLQNNVEMERLRLAQEMHDGPMQELYSAIYQIEELRRQVIPEHQETLENLKSDLQNILSDLRSTAKELRPPALATFGLEKAIRSHIEDLREKYPTITFHLTLAQDRQTLPEIVRLALFRVYQQSLSNVIRHAEASNVQVRFTFNAEQAELEIKDDGKGFEVPYNWVGFARQGHFGLAGAAERVKALDGVFTVESRPGTGTTVRVVMPSKEPSE